MLELADHNFKVAVITMLHEVRDYMFITNEMIENLSREINSIKKKNYMKILELKKKIFEIKKIQWIGLTIE